MRKKLLVICAFCLLAASACRETGTSPSATTTTNNNQATANNSTASSSGAESGAPATNTSGTSESKKPDANAAEVSTNDPKSVRDFFMLLPEKYFVLEGCDRQKDKDCRQARLDYLKTFVDVEDTQNGYLSGGCDGAQSCLDMAIFKRPDGSYLIGVSTAAEMMENNYFLDYRSGKWMDVSASVVPQFSRKNSYELPRYGTTVQVFAKRVLEKGSDYEITERGDKLYNLEWKDGKFAMKK